LRSRVYDIILINAETLINITDLNVNRADITFYEWYKIIFYAKMPGNEYVCVSSRYLK